MCTCDEALALLSAALDGELSAEEKKRLEEHLASCPACGALAPELGDLHALMPGEVEVPEGLHDGIMARIAAENVIPFAPKPKKRSVWRTWAPMAAVFAVVIVGAGVSMRMGYLGGGSSGGAAAPAQAPAAYSQSAGFADAAPQETPAVHGAGGNAADTVLPSTAPAMDGTGNPEETQSTNAAERAPTPAPELSQESGETAPRDMEPNMMLSAGNPAGAAPVAAPTAGAEPALTEAESAAMERLLGELEWTEYTWQTPYTAVLPRAEGAETETALSYTGLSGNERYYTFEVDDRIYEVQTEEPDAFHTSLVARYAVPLDGGDVVKGTDAAFDALINE